MPFSVAETTAADLPDLARLWNDGRVMRWVGFPDGLGLGDDELREWFERLQASSHEHHFVIRTPEAGFCGELFYRVDGLQRRAELDVKLLPGAQGQGTATAALSWLVERVLSSEPNVDAVWTEPVPENAAARALYTRCGLRETGRPLDLGPGPSYWERRRCVADTRRSRGTGVRDQ